MKNEIYNVVETSLNSAANAIDLAITNSKGIRRFAGRAGLAAIMFTSGYGYANLENPNKANAVEPDEDIEIVNKGDNTIHCVPAGEIWTIQSDAEPVENGNRRKSWHDSLAETALITKAGPGSCWWVGYGADIAKFQYHEGCPTASRPRSLAEASARRDEYTQRVWAEKFDNNGRKFERADVLDYPGKGQGE